MLVALYDNFTGIDWAGEARRKGLTALWPVARATVARTYQDWRRERDLAAVADALHELSDRQLRLIGMRRASVDDDVEALAEWVAERELGTRQLIRIAQSDAPAPARLTYAEPVAEDVIDAAPAASDAALDPASDAEREPAAASPAPAADWADGTDGAEPGPGAPMPASAAGAAPAVRPWADPQV